MCGIIGFASSKPIKDKKWLSIGRDAMMHRGPDDAGEWWSDDGRVGFGHRRLSIIDLTKSGHQPMQDSLGNVTVTFNGEIYNHLELKDRLRKKGYVFATHSDTEVLMACWQEWREGCVNYLNGMFAFAVHDRDMGVVYLARDRSGEKPLFYSDSNGELRFSSELKGLLVDPDFSHSIDYNAMDCYLSMGYIPGDMCILEGVNKLPPAHFMIFKCDTGLSKVSKYWSLPNYRNQERLDNRELPDRLEDLLQDAVCKQLAADVPVGVLLSGGVDSSLVTALASRCPNVNSIKTFNVAFKKNQEYDESDHAKVVAKYFNTEHVELEVDEINTNLLLQLAKQYDEPMADSSMLPTFLVSKLVRKHCTVALGGDGGDELFGGYHHYNKLLWMEKIAKWLPLSFRVLFSKAVIPFLPIGFRGRNWIQAFGTDFNNHVPLIGSFFDPVTRSKLLGKCHKKSGYAERNLRDRVSKVPSLLQRITRLDFSGYMAEDILVKVDRASMANSLEIRSPILDYRVIEFAFGEVPSALKTTKNERKILLKKISERLLPPEFDRERKQGFSIPLKEWLKEGPWRDLFHEILLSDECFFDKETVLSLFSGQDRGMHNAERLFSLVLFELWRREYGIS